MGDRKRRRRRMRRSRRMRRRKRRRRGRGSRRNRQLRAVMDSDTLALLRSECKRVKVWKVCRAAAPKRTRPEQHMAFM